MVQDKARSSTVCCVRRPPSLVSQPDSQGVYTLHLTLQHISLHSCVKNYIKFTGMGALGEEIPLIGEKMKVWDICALVLWDIKCTRQLRAQIAADSRHDPTKVNSPFFRFFSFEDIKHWLLEIREFTFQSSFLIFLLFMYVNVKSNLIHPPGTQSRWL